MKKKKVEAPYNDLNMRSNISLEWNEEKKSVVAKMEQIGITSRELISFLDIVPPGHNILADVFDVPYEIFELEDLTNVLSYEVWQSHLSEKERKYLSQFLPKGVEVHKVVQELFAGDNFHFSNPFLQWGASLCSRNCHPDVILRKEHCCKANKKVYYLGLQTYHNNIIGNLQTWKEKWAACKDPEKEFMQKFCRLRKSTHAIESRICDPEENLGATSESCSWVADDRACSIDSPNVAMKHGDNLRRMHDKGFLENKYYESSNGRKRVTRPGNGERVHKHNVVCDDGAKYMSYIKVSKEQHQRIKSSMKPSSDSIQHRSLNHVLGSLDDYRVQPYAVFEEEERRKLREHWYQLSSRDLPASYEIRRKWQLEKRQLSLSLGLEIKEKLNSLGEDLEKKKYHNFAQMEVENEASESSPIIAREVYGREKSDCLHQEQMGVGQTIIDPSIILEDEKDASSDSMYQHSSYIGATNHNAVIEDEHEDEPAQNQPLQQHTLLGDSQESLLVDVDSDDNNLMLGKADDFTDNASVYTDKLSHSEGPDVLENSLPSASVIWGPGGLPSAYYQQHTSVGREYRSASEMSLGHSQVMQEQSIHVMDLEADMHERDQGRILLQRQTGNDESFLNPYPIQDQNEVLLQSLLKTRGSLPYHHEPKLTGSSFLPTPSNIMLDRFPGSMQETSLQLELMRKRLSDNYMHQNTQENMLTNGGRGYSASKHEHFSPMNHVQDWAVNGNINMSASSSQSHLNGNGMLNQNWYSSEPRSRDEWPALEGVLGTNQSFGHGTNVADQSLFSVLSQCNGSHSSTPYASSVGSCERLVQPGNFVGMSGVGSVPLSVTSSMLQQTANPLNYLNGQDASGGNPRNSMGWINVSHQNTALQDPMGKTFLRSWNNL